MSDKCECNLCSKCGKPKEAAPVQQQIVYVPYPVYQPAPPASSWANPYYPGNTWITCGPAA